MTAPRISVLMPVRNAGAYLRSAVDSVLRQTFADFELIAIDDGSTDGSFTTLHSIAEHDPRVRVVAGPARGVARALNHAAQLARGEYFARMDADDVTEPGRFAAQLDFLDSNPGCVAVGCHVRAIDAAGWPIGIMRFPTEPQVILENLLDVKLVGAGLCHPAAMIRAATFREISGYRENFTRAQDRDLWLRLADRGDLANLPLILHSLRLHTGSVSQQNLRENYEMRWRAINDACARRGLVAPALTPPANEMTTPTDQHRKWAEAAASSSHPLTALKHAMLYLGAAPHACGRYVWLCRLATMAVVGSLIRRGHAPRGKVA